MANLKIFLSSTCYDLAVVRSQLRNFFFDLGYEPVLSEYSDVLFDPRQHTHTSCLQEIPNCDMIVLIIGSRFGGGAIPEALDKIDLDKVKEASKAKNFGSDGKFSVTQLEVLNAIQSGIPIFTFVDSGVLHDHLTYEKNKDKPILKDIEFPHIEKQETAIYIFEFINYLRLRTENNNVIEFSKLDDIEEHLKKQWSSLFQRLLFEQRNKQNEAQRIDFIANQIADIKTAIMTSISDSKLKETAKGAIKFRTLLEFIYYLATESGRISVHEVLTSDREWGEILKIFHINDVFAESSKTVSSRTILLLQDETYFRTNLHPSAIKRIETEWDMFRQLTDEVRQAIINAVIDNSDIRFFGRVKYFPEKYEFEDGYQSTSVRQDSDEDIPF